MRRKVASGDLDVGMYLVELDRPWKEVPFEPPFEVQGFTILENDIDKVRDFCQYAYIDPKLGKGARHYLHDDKQLKEMSEVFASLPTTSRSPQVYKDQTTLELEIPGARHILNDTNALCVKIINDLERGLEHGAEEIQNVVTGLVESVIRNPEALSWLSGLKRKDNDTYVHAISVAILALTVGRYLGLPKDRLHALGTATLLQDIGKMALPSYLLNKTDHLTAEEWDTLKEHVEESVELLENSRNFNIEVIHIVRLHHERFDGSGYPQGLTGHDIPLLSTISGIVDCYQAGISPRPYRRAKTSFQILMELYEQRDIAFAGGMIEQFIQCVGIFPIGSFVELNTREIGIVVQRNQIQQLKPKVMILIDDTGRLIENPETIDLAAQYLAPNQIPRVISAVVDPKCYDLDPGKFFV